MAALREGPEVDRESMRKIESQRERERVGVGRVVEGEGETQRVGVGGGEWVIKLQFHLDYNMSTRNMQVVFMPSQSARLHQGDVNTATANNKIK